MHATADRLEFAPPPTAGLLRALALAVLAHAVLLAALTWGVRWKSEAELVTAQAELWSAVPQVAAPRLVEAPPPAPPPAPVAPPQAAPALPAADIALEREKQRLKTERQQAAAKLERERREKQQQALEQQRELEQKLALDKKKAEQETRRKEELKAQQEATKAEAQRKANMQRIAGLAGATGAPAATGAAGAAVQSSGPSASYAGRVSAKVKPNIVFTEDLAGNPTAEVEVRAAVDGTIVSRRLLKSSGSKSWDDAVLKAIDKTEVLPRDVDGRIPPLLVISFRPRDY